MYTQYLLNRYLVVGNMNKEQHPLMKLGLEIERCSRRLKMLILFLVSMFAFWVVRSSLVAIQDCAYLYPCRLADDSSSTQWF